MIRIGQKGEGKIFERIVKGLQPERLDRIVDKVAFVTLAELVKASPKKWFGQIRSGWRVTKPQLGARLLNIDPARKSGNGETSVADIAKWVDQGTANNGQGFIYPKEKKRLYIPLKRTAIVWREGLRYGVDYVMARKVRGIKGRKFVAPVRRAAHVRLNEAFLAHIKKLAQTKS